MKFRWFGWLRKPIKEAIPLPVRDRATPPELGTLEHAEFRLGHQKKQRDKWFDRSEEGGWRDLDAEACLRKSEAIAAGIADWQLIVDDLRKRKAAE